MVLRVKNVDPENIKFVKSRKLSDGEITHKDINQKTTRNCSYFNESSAIHPFTLQGIFDNETENLMHMQPLPSSSDHYPYIRINYFTKLQRKSRSPSGLRWSPPWWQRIPHILRRSLRFHRSILKRTFMSNTSRSSRPSTSVPSCHRCRTCM